MLCRRWAPLVAALALLLGGCQSSAEPNPRTANPLTIRTGVGLAALAATSQFVWAPVKDTGRLLKIDASSGRVLTAITIGDPRRLVSSGCGPYSVHQMPMGSLQGRMCDLPSAVAASEAQVWVTKNDSDELLRIDPQTNRIVARVALGLLPFDLAISPAGDAVWVTDYKDSEVARVDTAANSVVARFSIPRAANVAVSPDSAWVTNRHADSVTRIAVFTNRVTAVIPVGVKPLALTFAYGSLWVKNEDSNTVSRIDPSTNRVVATIRVEDRLCCDGIDRIAAADGRIFVDDLDLEVIDPATNRVVGRVQRSFISLAAAGGVLWGNDVTGEVVELRTRELASAVH